MDQEKSNIILGNCSCGTTPTMQIEMRNLLNLTLTDPQSKHFKAPFPCLHSAYCKYRMALICAICVLNIIKKGKHQYSDVIFIFRENGSLRHVGAAERKNVMKSKQN